MPGSPGCRSTHYNSGKRGTAAREAPLFSITIHHSLFTALHEPLGHHHRLQQQATIRRCLESVAWADEIVVPDSGSTDRTMEISREFTALFHGGWAFFRTFFLRVCFLDGREGLMLAIANAKNSYYRYAKLALLGKKTVIGDK